MNKGTVFNIQKMSIHDGPGIRTTVFFKGCPLSCLWCSNPESQRVEKEVACFQTRCVKCGYCAEVCPKGLIERKPPFEITGRSECDLCGICVKECCTNGKKVVGEDYTVEELLHEVLKDKSFYDSSGGGVTFSGGEPLMQHEFLVEMLKACKQAGLHTAIETTGFGNTADLLSAAEYLDLVFFENLAALAADHNNIIVRIPVVPGLNDDDINIAKTAEYITSVGISQLELLPYHNLGEVKYGQIGRTYELSEVKTPDEERMAQLAGVAKAGAKGRTLEVSVMKSL